VGKIDIRHQTSSSTVEIKGAQNERKKKKTSFDWLMAAAASAAGSAMAADLSPVERRLKQLERLLLTSGEDGAVTTAATSSSSSSTSTITISVETLLDALLVLYDECFTSALRREKTVSDFLELSTSISFSV
jgi:hypothetical protein